MFLDLRFSEQRKHRRLKMMTIAAIPSRMTSSIGSSVTTVSYYLGAAWSRYTGWKAGRDTRHALNSLDDRALADIGVSRGGIEAVVRDIERRKSQWAVL
jgi:uncharacterized protein YjiS (DUF1127 family)